MSESMNVTDIQECVTIEKALNSRCSCDFSGGQRTTHHGSFDPSNRLSDEGFARFIQIADAVPRYSYWPIRVFRESEFVIFHISGEPTGIDADWLHIENGMQQYAVMIACAACGVGSRIREYGVDGIDVGGGWIATVNLLLSRMLPAYDNSYWTTDAPGEPNPWISGNLPNPQRDGTAPLIDHILALSFSREGVSQASPDTWSQLLWAARGRTPHYYHGTPWGMTVPVWVGLQTLTTVYLVNAEGTNRYVNWIGERPTHSVTKINQMDFSRLAEASDWLQWAGAAIILGVNDNRRVAYWEIGFEMEALLLQVTALGIPYQARLLTQSERDAALRAGIQGAQAALLF